MPKPSNSYLCTNCKYQSIKWIGCCPECSQWNTLTQVTPQLSKNTSPGKQTALLTTLDKAPLNKQKRLLSGINEWDRVMGGGIVSGSLLAVSGDPGIGKSTLLLQVAHALAYNCTVHYFSTEESLHQITQRAHRLTLHANNLLFSDASCLETILHTIHNHKPDLIIIDSIQNCYNKANQTTPGSITQLREATFELMHIAKELNLSIIVSGHITKEGIIAGPKTLEHMVDGVFYLQSEDKWQIRILRAVKNRFGTTNELGFFQMHSHGLEEISNVNQYLLNDTTESPGAILTAFKEGSRPLLLELQALTIKSKLAIPQRVISGVDHKQVILIAAILEKYLTIKLSNHDIFFKISGAFKIKEHTIDLGIALALLSSYFQQSVSSHAIAFGEISVTGQLKPINNIDMLIKEAEKLGLKHCFVAKKQKLPISNMSITQLSNVYELLSLFPH